MTFNLTALKKFVMYQIQMLAYTAVGDGVISSSAISVRTFEDGTHVYTNLCHKNIRQARCNTPFEMIVTWPNG